LEALRTCLQKHTKNKTCSHAEGGTRAFSFESPLKRITEGNPATPTVDNKGVKLKLTPFYFLHVHILYKHLFRIRYTESYILIVDCIHNSKVKFLVLPPLHMKPVNQ
jgi:hypothetical protein